MVSTTPGKYKLYTGVNDTGDTFFVGVVNTREKIRKGSNGTGILGGLGDTNI
jgi:hypothetical protein